MKFRPALGAALLMLAGIGVASAQVFGPIQLNRNGSEITQNQASATGQFFHMPGIAYVTTATAATVAGTGEQTLATYALPAGALDLTGRAIRLCAMFSKAANTDATTAKLYFGSEVISGGSNTTSGAGTRLCLFAVKTGASTQIVTGYGTVATSVVTPYSSAGAETDTAAITLKATCQDGTSAAGDCTLQEMRVIFEN